MSTSTFTQLLSSDQFIDIGCVFYTCCDTMSRRQLILPCLLTLIVTLSRHHLIDTAVSFILTMTL